ncbi:MAG: AAA family ATPase, partial [Actinomycetota bacterium]
MLEEVRIRSLGVITDAVLELGPGLTVVTGETGAGKTMVVTALGLLLAAPLYALAFLQTDWRLAALLLLPAGVCQYLYLGPT